MQEVIAEESAGRAEEIKAEFIAKHRQLQSEIRILPHGAAIDRLFGVVSQGARTVVAFDFDQTLTFVAAGADGQREKGLRGGNAARSALRGLHAAGVRMAIVTAQSPSLQTVRTLSGELHALGIAELFGVPADGAREAVLDALAEWGDHAALPPERLLARLVLLLLLKSDRSAADLARISLSQTRGVVSPAAADDEVDALCCRLRALGGGGDDGAAAPSAELRIAADSARPRTCAVRCWQAYVRQTSSLCRAPPADDGGAEDGAAGVAAVAPGVPLRAADDDTLLVHPTLGRALTAEEIHQISLMALAECGVGDAAAQQAVLAPEASVVKIGGDIPVARVGHAMASRYNKPEALQHWLEAEGLADTVQKVIFVDDNSDNVFNTFMHFATAEADGRAPAPRACAVWYPPPPPAAGEKSREEHYDETTRELLTGVCRGELPPMSRKAMRMLGLN